MYEIGNQLCMILIPTFVPADVPTVMNNLTPVVCVCVTFSEVY